MLFQVDTTALVETVAETAQPTMTLWQMAQFGGWIMVVLAILLAIAIYLFVERMIVIRRAKNEDQSFMAKVKDYIHEGKMDSAIELCRQSDTPAARMPQNGPRRFQAERPADFRAERVPEPVRSPRRDPGAATGGVDRFGIGVRRPLFAEYAGDVRRVFPLAVDRRRPCSPPSFQVF